MTILMSPELVRLLQAEREREMRRESVARTFRAAISCCRGSASMAGRLVARLRGAISH